MLGVKVHFNRDRIRIQFPYMILPVKGHTVFVRVEVVTKDRMFLLLTFAEQQRPGYVKTSNHADFVQFTRTYYQLPGIWENKMELGVPAKVSYFHLNDGEVLLKIK